MEEPLWRAPTRLAALGSGARSLSSAWYSGTVPENLITQAAMAWIEAHHEDLLADYQAVLRIRSIESDPEPNAPFGKENRVALDWMLDKAKAAGMETIDMEGYCGYADFGKGDGMVLTMGHLDVVPVGPGWTFEPFSATIHEGYCYARGAVDDKGPTIAMFYAARALKECWPDIPVRLRSFFGCNEESGFKCIEHYVQNGGEVPTLGVAPDAGWPLIHGEKGIANFEITTSGGILNAPNVKLVALQGGQRPNIVIDSATATVEVSAEAKSYVEKKLNEYWDRNLTCTWSGKTLNIESVGKAAHGSTPWAGDNAVTRIFRMLRECSPLPDQDLYNEAMYMGHVSGAGIGISMSDEPSGHLTANLGIAELKDGVLTLTINIRYPVTFNAELLIAKCNEKLASYKGAWKLSNHSDSKPLYFPVDHPLVKVVVDAYADETGEVLKPGTMGGGTYARAIPNCAAIGTGWSGDGEAHQTDEKLKVEHLYKMARIYARVLVGLCEAAAK